MAALGWTIAGKSLGVWDEMKIANFLSRWEKEELQLPEAWSLVLFYDLSSLM
jgi:hypothetical protein